MVTHLVMVLLVLLLIRLTLFKKPNAPSFQIGYGWNMV